MKLILFSFILLIGFCRPKPTTNEQAPKLEKRGTIETN